MRERERYTKRVGTVVGGRWRIDDLLGWGSTSAVYAATHRNGHRAALKILHQSLCSDPATVERFLREAGIANAIKHRSIVTINDDGITEEGCAYLVLELLEGETLEELRERNNGRMSLEDFGEIAEDLMSAIAAVHAAGIVHRDLKPGNVFITKEGELKLLDFGTARIFDWAAGSKLSMQGLVIGTPAFMSPEQARGARADVDAQSDVWSLGAMIFTVLSGDYVHVGRDQHARLLAAAMKPARSLASVMPTIDGRIATVVDRALAFAKNERWPDVQSMRLAFGRSVVSSVPTMRQLKAFADVTAEDETASTVSASDPTLVMARPSFESSSEASSESSSASSSAEAALPVPPLVLVPEAPHSESEAPAVSSTQGRPAVVSRGIPLPALVIGFAAVAAMVMLVVFFMAGGDEPTGTGTAAAATVEPAPSAPAEPATIAAPSASFIVISAPDDPVPAPKPKPAVPSWSIAPKPKLTAPAPVSPKPVPQVETKIEKAEAKPESPELAAPVSTPPEAVAADAGAGTGAGGAALPVTVPKGGVAPSANEESP